MTHAEKLKLFIRKVLVCCSAGIVLAATVAGYAVPAAAFLKTDLGTLNSYAARSIPTAINNAGQIVGYSLSNMHDHAFLWENGVMTDLGTLGGFFSYAYDINDSGQIVGWSSVSGGLPMHAFLWKSGVMTDLGTLTSSESYVSGINNAGQVIGISGVPFLWQNGVMTMLDFGAAAINNHGQIAGMQREADGTVRAIVWKDGVAADIGRIDSRNTRPLFINDAGQVAGNSYEANPNGRTEIAFFWENGTIKSLGTLGGSFSAVTGMSQKGHVVGESATVTGDIHGFLWKDGVMTDLGTLGGAYSLAQAVNSAGQVVGLSLTVSNRGHAFLWQNGTMTDLGTLQSPYPENDYSNAYLINEAGQIVGVSYPPHAGDLHGVMWTTKDAPELLADLTGMIGGYALPVGLSTSLGAKLRNARAHLAAGNTKAACNSIQAFVQESEAQSGKALMQEQANRVIYSAETIARALSCR